MCKDEISKDGDLERSQNKLERFLEKNVEVLRSEIWKDFQSEIWKDFFSKDFGLKFRKIWG